MAQEGETLEQLQATGGAVRTPTSVATAERGAAVTGEAAPPQAAPPQPDVAGAYERRAGAIEASGARRADIEKQIAEKTAAEMRGISERFEPQFKATPEFKAPKEEGQQIAGLIAMMGALAALGGGKSYGNALGAMNAMAGMLNGYREGRKEVFDKAKTEYDKSVQAIKAHNDQITAAYNRALKMAPANLSAATAQLRSELTAMDAKLQAETVRTQGIEKASQAWQTARREEQRLDQLRQTQQRHEQNLQQRQAEMQQREQLAAQRREGRTPDPNAPIRVTARPEAAFSGVNKSLDGYTKILSQSQNDNLKREWSNSGVMRFLAEPISDSYLSRAGSIIARSRLSPEARTLAETVMQARNAYYLETSGKAVTGSEAMRNFGAVIQPTDSWDDLMRKAKESLRDAISNGDILVSSYAFPRAGIQNYEQKKVRALELVGESPAPRQPTTTGRTASQADVKATADARFGGDIEKAKAALRERGFRIEGD